jgi:Fe-S cluster assembly protein SufD
MDLKEKLVSSFIAFENQVDIDSYVHEIRSEAIKNFESIGFPTKKNESWKYTSLKQVLILIIAFFQVKTQLLFILKLKNT